MIVTSASYTQVKQLSECDLNSTDEANIFIDLRFMQEIQSYTQAVGSDNWHEIIFYSNITWVLPVH